MHLVESKFINQLTSYQRTNERTNTVDGYHQSSLFNAEPQFFIVEREKRQDHGATPVYQHYKTEQPYVPRESAVSLPIQIQSGIEHWLYLNDGLKKILSRFGKGFH